MSRSQREFFEEYRDKHKARALMHLGEASDTSRTVMDRMLSAFWAAAEWENMERCGYSARRAGEGTLEVAR